MSTNAKVDRVLARVDPSRRDALRKILGGAAVYSVPVVATFPLDTLADVEVAPRCANQTDIICKSVPVPTAPVWGLAALGGMLAAVGAFLGRKRRGSEE